ncbi:proteasome assembly chaperone 4 [Lissotriton helveticus]
MDEGDTIGTRGISLHDFSEKLGELRVHFHVMRLSGGFFLWVGSSGSFSSLAVAMCSRYDSIPVATCILGDSSDTTSSSFAQRLAKKTKKLVFVSYNLPNTDGNLALLVENRIKQEMETFPEKF